MQPPNEMGGLPQGQPPQMPPEGDIGPSGELPAEQLAQQLNKNRGLA